MRLRKIRLIEEANSFLKEYLPVYNKRFSVPDAKSADLHRPLPKGIDLDRILCKKTEHTLRNDWTVAHDKKLYQVENNILAKKVTVEERTDGSMLIWHKNMALKFKGITVRPQKITEASKPHLSARAHTPPKDHPWHNFRFGSSEKKEEALVVAL